MWSYVAVIMVIMVDMATSTEKVTARREILYIDGSPQLGYYVQLGLGTPYKMVSVCV